jgi:hypothetical protein
MMAWRRAPGQTDAAPVRPDEDSVGPADVRRIVLASIPSLREGRACLAHSLARLELAQRSYPLPPLCRVCADLARLSDQLRASAFLALTFERSTEPLHPRTNRRSTAE